MNIKTQSFLILGVSKSGYFAAKYILSSGGKCFLFEENASDKVKEKIEELVSLGAKQINDEEIDDLLRVIDAVIISPGVPINHHVAVKAKRDGVKIIGELEFGYSALIPPIIAVTGTNGKTTTVSMIKSVFENDGKNVFAVGNIGVPITEKENDILARKDGIIVCETSSFQLESIADFKPHVACVLNIAPDHLERHYTMENYVFLKKRILKNLTQTEYAVLNFDDETVKTFSEGIKAKTIWVSVKEKVNGAYVSDGKLYYKDEQIIEISNLALKEPHNVYNALFAVAVCKIYGVSDEVIRESLENFKGVPHRIELVAEENGVKFFDDSKATNTASAITAIGSMKAPTVIIVGGSEKGETYDELFAKIKENGLIRHVVITGASGLKMLDSAGRIGLGNITYTRDFNVAVKIAKSIAENGDNVLLSPACASFDDFKNYEERGNVFKNLIGGSF